MKEIKEILTKDQIINGVSSYFNKSNSELLHGDRTGDNVKPRHIAMYFLRVNTDMYHEDILNMFGKKQRGTVIHAVRSVVNQINIYPDYANMIEEIKKAIVKTDYGYDDIYLGNDFNN